MGALVTMLGLMLGGSALATETPAPAPEPATEQIAAEPADDGMPHWRAEDYRHLMAGELITGYTSLFPAKPTPEEIKAEEERQKQLRREQRELRRQQARQNIPRTRPPEAPEESNTRVLGRYFEQYTRPPQNTALNDPQGLLTTVEREDVEHVLRNLNANARFRIYVSVFKGGQDIPSDLAVDLLVTATAQPCEYAVLMRYPTGNPAGIELGYQEIKPGDAQRHEWLQKVRTAAADGSTEGLMDALRCISSIITPLAGDFTPVATTTGGKAPLIDIQFKETQKEKKRTIRDRIEELINDPVVVKSVLYPLGVLAGIGLIWLLLDWMRSSSRLEDSESDLRLSSPYGAGVSRYVRYLEGTEAEKEKRIF
jgi:hypothetical protein